MNYLFGFSNAMVTLSMEQKWPLTDVSHLNGDTDQSSMTAPLSLRFEGEECKLARHAKGNHEVMMMMMMAAAAAAAAMVFACHTGSRNACAANWFMLLFSGILVDRVLLVSPRQMCQGELAHWATCLNCDEPPWRVGVHISRIAA
jgi:hypothetical protein